ncbi:MAG: hypothetical protein H0X66_11920 [Verrucomicrobia bacterium]|nr:hypothetical protein [Verrucomicrobiota bacterium]
MQRLFICFLALWVSLLSIRAEPQAFYIGEALGDSLIFTSRTFLEEQYRQETTDGRPYRLGKDLVVFVNEGVKRPASLYMCPAKDFTEKELQSFQSSMERKDLPPRNHPMFNRLQVTGRKPGFH